MKNHELIQRCKNNDRDAQYRLYKLYANSVYNTIIRIIPTEFEAEEILQDTFIKAFKNLTQLNGQYEFISWISRIATNTCLDFIKKKKINYVSLHKETYEEDFINTDDYQHEKQLEKIHQEIKKLPDGARIVLVLHLFNGLKYREIAEKLDISESTCKSQYYRAKNILRQRINQYSI